MCNKLLFYSVDSLFSIAFSYNISSFRWMFV
nr:MAG TPA: hypothetical protein [Crassvirales sp.]